MIWRGSPPSPIRPREAPRKSISPLALALGQRGGPVGRASRVGQSGGRLRGAAKNEQHHDDR
jgi:hypothetical protein